MGMADPLAKAEADPALLYSSVVPNSIIYPRVYSPYHLGANVHQLGAGVHQYGAGVHQLGAGVHQLGAGVHQLGGVHQFGAYPYAYNHPSYYSQGYVYFDT